MAIASPPRAKLTKNRTRLPPVDGPLSPPRPGTLEPEKRPLAYGARVRPANFIGKGFENVDLSNAPFPATDGPPAARPTTIRASTSPLRSSLQGPIKHRPSKSWSVQFSSSPEDGVASPASSCQSTPTGPPLNNRASFPASRAEDRNGAVSRDRSSGLSAWFTGSSAPVTLGLSAGEEDPERAESRASSEQSGDSGSRHAMKQANSSRFSLFSTKSSGTSSPTKSTGSCSPPKSSPTRQFSEEDALLSLNMRETFRQFHPISSPSLQTFTDMQNHAEALFSKLQVAYRTQTARLDEVTLDNRCLEEDLDEADTRAHHLRIQLDQFAERFSAQEKAMAQLVDELAQERQRRNEAESAQRGLAQIRNYADLSNFGPGHGHNRKSATSPASDSGFESEDDSLSARLVRTKHLDNLGMPWSLQDVPPNRPAPIHRPSNHQRAFDGLSISTDGSVGDDLGVGRVVGRGGEIRSSPSEEAARVACLQEENRALKERNRSLEDALENSLAMVSEFDHILG